MQEMRRRENEMREVVRGFCFVLVAIVVVGPFYVLWYHGSNLVFECPLWIFDVLKFQWPSRPAYLSATLGLFLGRRGMGWRVGCFAFRAARATRASYGRRRKARRIRCSTVVVAAVVCIILVIFLQLRSYIESVSRLQRAQQRRIFDKFRLQLRRDSFAF